MPLVSADGLNQLWECHAWPLPMHENIACYKLIHIKFFHTFKRSSIQWSALIGMYQNLSTSLCKLCMNKIRKVMFYHFCFLKTEPMQWCQGKTFARIMQKMWCDSNESVAINKCDPVWQNQSYSLKAYMFA